MLYFNTIAYVTSNVPLIQVVEELRLLLDYIAKETGKSANITALSLSSRRNLCIHPEVGNLFLALFLGNLFSLVIFFLAKFGKSDNMTALSLSSRRNLCIHPEVGDLFCHIFNNQLLLIFLFS